jgi:hypothetical protein
MMRLTGFAPTVLLQAYGVVSAQLMVVVQDVSSLTGKWKGPGGPGALGNNPLVIVEQTNNPDGTYEAVVTLSSGQRVPSKGTMMALPDGTIAYEDQATAGVLPTLRGQRAAGDPRRSEEQDYRGCILGRADGGEIKPSLKSAKLKEAH